jgi:predicted deacylase
VVLYVGSIHGNEYSTKYLLDEWIDELETNANNIPDNRKLVVVPLLNPDGLARSSRYNAGGIDLNRNFPTEDWQKNVYSPSNQLITGGGGSTSLSEPESKAIANLSTQLRPILTMSFHGSAGYAIANQAAGSAALAAKYAQMTGYNNMTGVSGAFSYPITGTYDDWLREKYGLKSILIELSSNTYSEFSRNKAALWEMVKL